MGSLVSPPVTVWSIGSTAAVRGLRRTCSNVILMTVVVLLARARILDCGAMVCCMHMKDYQPPTMAMVCPHRSRYMQWECSTTGQWYFWARREGWNMPKWSLGHHLWLLLGAYWWICTLQADWLPKLTYAFYYGKNNYKFEKTSSEQYLIQISAFSSSHCLSML